MRMRSSFEAMHEETRPLALLDQPSPARRQDRPKATTTPGKPGWWQTLVTAVTVSIRGR